MRKYKIDIVKKTIKKAGDYQPGDLISKVNESKDIIRNKTKPQTPIKTRVSIMGLV